MKIPFSLSELLQLVFISAIFLPASLSFFLSFSPTQKESLSTQETWGLNSEDDILSQALSQAFPSSIDHNPAYAAALGVFRDLESKPSCHRTAAASLVFDCSAVGDKSDQNGMLKITYAAQLAVCEFEATGIKFPQECKGLNDGKFQEIRSMKCVKKLEERPQWWTTLSNNIQSAVVMCSAAKHEVEKDEILTLHANITKTQKSLFSALTTSLHDAWESITAQKEFAGAWKRALNDMLGDLIKTRREVMSALKAAETDATRTINRIVEEEETRRKENRETASEFGQFILRARDGFRELEERSKMVSEVAERAALDFSTDVNAHKEVIKQNSYLVHQVNSILSFEMSSSIDRLLRAVDTLSSEIMDSSVQLKTLVDTSGSYSSLFTSISSSYLELAERHMALTISLNKQEETQQRLLSLLEKTHHSTNTTFEHLLTTTDSLSQDLDDMSIKIRSWNINGLGQAGTSIGSMIFIFGVLLGRGGVGVGVGLISPGILVVVLILHIFIAYIQLTGWDSVGILTPKGLRQLSLEVGSFTGESLNTTDHTILFPGVWVCFGYLIAGIVTVSVVMFAFGFRCYRSRASMAVTEGLN